VPYPEVWTTQFVFGVLRPGTNYSILKVFYSNSFITLGHTSLVGLIELSADLLVSAAADSCIRVWNPMTGECLSCITGHQAPITCFRHDVKLNRIISGSDGGIKVKT
jgi:WD40 repeat protein